MNAIKWGRSGLLALPMCACLVLSGCKDDGDDDLDLVDGGDSGVGVDGGLDGSVPTDASFADFKIVKTPVSPTGHDRFFAVSYDEQGNIYAAGQTLPGVANSDDGAFLVAKYTAAGELDKTFGAPNGYVTHNIVPGGQNVEAARGLVVYKAGTANAGKIVIAGEADDAALGLDGGVRARDTDVVLLRLNANGTRDTTFGTDGVVRLELGVGAEVSATTDAGITTSLAAADTVWSIGLTSDGKLVLHGGSRAEGNAADGGPRTDTDFTLVRLLETGALDTSFATTGVIKTDVAQVNGSARSATVLSDNSVVAVGYTPGSSPLLAPNGQQPVLYKVKADGSRDTAFGGVAGGSAVADPAGVWHNNARADLKNAEAYGAAAQSDGKFVTVGYGPTPDTTGTGSDWVFFRFNANGSQDKTFGTGGQTFLDPGKLGDNGRAITILPDNRVIGVGGGRPAQAANPDGGTPPNVDGMIAVLSANGAPDLTFQAGTGIRLLDWGNTDFLHAVAVTPAGQRKQVAIVGAAGGGREPTSADDAVLVLWTLP